MHSSRWLLYYSGFLPPSPTMHASAGLHSSSLPEIPYILKAGIDELVRSGGGNLIIPIMPNYAAVQRKFSEREREGKMFLSFSISVTGGGGSMYVCMEWAAAVAKRMTTGGQTLSLEEEEGTTTNFVCPRILENPHRCKCISNQALGTHVRTTCRFHFCQYKIQVHFGM